jgi:hypothetical protein
MAGKVLTKLEEWLKFLEGKKTYLVALVWIARAVFKYTTNHDADMLFDRLLEGVGVTTLRAGMKK